MPNRIQQLKKLVKRYEQQAKRQIDAMDRKASPQVLQGVRRLRRTLNTQLMQLERSLAKRAKKSKRR